MSRRFRRLIRAILFLRHLFAASARSFYFASLKPPNPLAPAWAISL